jgi:3,4-dihydroxy 2-butanone 4-phosphate synthase/GTP cyclohydrolase II
MNITSPWFVEQAGSGVVVYLRQEGKGIGLVNEIRSYAQQDAGTGSADADGPRGLETDLRSYGIGAQILRALGVRKIRLLTNHPKKIVGLQGYGIVVSEQVPLEVAAAGQSDEILRAKK